MKKFVVAFAASLMLPTAAANAEPYISILGGPTWAPDLNVAGTKRAMDTGFNVGGRAGMTLENWNLPNLALEADFLFNRSNFDANNAGRIESSSYMANLVYRAPLSGPWSLYGGAGLGAVNTNFDNSIGNHTGSSIGSNRFSN